LIVDQEVVGSSPTSRPILSFQPYNPLYFLVLA
jgi:hypothetical protein